MRHILSAIFLSIIFLSFNACETSEFNQDHLVGRWKVEKWTIEATGKARTNKMDMEYKSDGTYSVDYGPENEIGRYWISGSYLHTFEKDASEKTVLIQKLSADTLKIQMNRAGEFENVLLIKK